MKELLLTQLEYLLRIIVAMVCGGVIGFERETHMKTAGIRTHIIVAAAASLMMIVSKYGFFDVLIRSDIRLDPSRIAAGVVTAIGFLGAGVIFVRNQNINGITTAAGIWATVGIGIALGAGMYLIGVAVAILIVIVQFLLHKKSKLSFDAITQQITLRIGYDDDVDHIMLELFETHQIKVLGVKAKKVSDSEILMKLSVKYPESYQAADILRILKSGKNIQSIEN